MTHAVHNLFISMSVIVYYCILKPKTETFHKSLSWNALGGHSVSTKTEIRLELNDTVETDYFHFTTF